MIIVLSPASSMKGAWSTWVNPPQGSSPGETSPSPLWACFLAFQSTSPSPPTSWISLLQWWGNGQKRQRREREGMEVQRTGVRTRELLICAVISQLSLGQLHHLLVTEQSAAAQIYACTHEQNRLFRNIWLHNLSQQHCMTFVDVLCDAGVMSVIRTTNKRYQLQQMLFICCCVVVHEAKIELTWIKIEIIITCLIQVTRERGFEKNDFMTKKNDVLLCVLVRGCCEGLC